MTLAEIEAFLSRPIAPTRRVALGDTNLPVAPPPGFGGVLLGGVIARFAPFVDDELIDDLARLMLDVETGSRIAQPRLRHRFQSDRVGLQRVRHRLLCEGEALRFDLDEDRGTPAQHLLAAVYAVGRVPFRQRTDVMDTLRKGLGWSGPLDDRLIATLTGRTASVGVAGIGDPVQWALAVLELDLDLRSAVPPRPVVQSAFRDLIRNAHPDHGGAAGHAAKRIAELSEARHILLS